MESFETMQTVYTSLKVNNEIEICEIDSEECRKLIEKALLKNRISYYIRWPKRSIFRRNKEACIICVNETAKETAEDTIRNICSESNFRVKFLMKKASVSYLWKCVKYFKKFIQFVVDKPFAI